MSSVSDSPLSCMVAAACALATVASIFARLRTIPASPISRATSSSPNSATRAISKPANAARKFSRLRRIVSHERPDWNASRQSFSYSASASRTGLPHSSSW